MCKGRTEKLSHQTFSADQVAHLLLLLLYIIILKESSLGIGDPIAQHITLWGCIQTTKIPHFAILT